MLNNIFKQIFGVNVLYTQEYVKPYKYLKEGFLV